MRTSLSLVAALTLAGGAAAQTASTSEPSITLYELPAYLGRSVTVTTATTDLATQSFARRAQSARVTGSWQVCGAESYAGTCRTLSANTPYLARSAAVSLRPAGEVTATGATAPATGANGVAGTAVDLDALDVAEGTAGQDVAFYARPALGTDQISAGTNDTAAGNAFCQRAGATTAVYAGRARVQTSNLIDLSTRARVRGFALRDVLCRR